MKSCHFFVGIYFVLALLSAPGLAKQPDLIKSSNPIPPISIGTISTSKAQPDSILIMGPWDSGAPFNGQFQNEAGLPDWNGWTHRDLTIPEGGNHWHVDSYQADGLAGHGAENLAVWCGSMEYEACSEIDPEGGYGNNYNDPLVWTFEVEDPAAPSIVLIDAWLNIDLEPGYDFLKVLRRQPGMLPEFEVIAEYDGTFTNQHLAWEIHILAGDYSGAEANEIELRFQVVSDGAWSDEDCLFSGAGACQIDDISVHVDNGSGYTFDDFQSGELGNWVAVDLHGHGDFSQIRSNLDDLDDCKTNYSPQVCFIDDGIVVPGTGGSLCIDWCYGPGGYIVNPRGGLLPLPGSMGGLRNAVDSPVMPWPETAQSGLLEFGAYTHEQLNTDSSQMFYSWQVRSTSSPDPADISQEFWEGESFVYYGGPNYKRIVGNLNNYLVENPRHVQVRLMLIQLAWWWELGENGTPAPYFDNVRVTAIEPYGPDIILNNIDLAGDSFPESGILDPDNLETNSVRFDSNRGVNNSGDDFEAVDTIKMAIFTQGEGEELLTPRIYYRLIPNPVFDAARSSGLPNSGYMEGFEGDIENIFHFDLPDTGFFYPGDIIHYYFSATQTTSGGSLEAVIVPADTTGFSENPWGANSQQPGLENYNESFIVRALPSVGADFEHPKILIWDDSGEADYTEALRHDLNQAQAWNLHEGFDLYRRSSRISQRTLSWDSTVEILSGYDAIFYFSGSTDLHILGFDLAGEIPLLIQWLEENENRGLFVSGNKVHSTLNYSSVGRTILNDYLGVQHEADDLAPLIQDMVYPEVLIDPMQPGYLGSIENWIVSGFCPGSNPINAVLPLPGAVRIGEFAGVDGQGGQYPYSALTAFTGPNQTLSFSMPYDFRRIMQPAGFNGDGLSLRSLVLMHLAGPFIGYGIPVVDMSPVPERLGLSAIAYPNPFNPSTTIDYSLPKDGHLSLKVYNLRGELVRTLVDEARLAGAGKAVWSGDDQSGSPVASGVYFYRLRQGDDVIIKKLLMVK